MTEASGEQGAPGEQLLDPFSFHVGVASRIKGLGGPDRGFEPNYAFHTSYVESETGFSTFTLRFTGLKATHGTLQLWLNMLPLAQGSPARVANSERIQLNRIVAQGGETSIRFEGFRGVSYALHGQVVDETDATAEALVVALDRPRDPNRTEEAIEARSSSFGGDSIEPANHIVILDRATFQTPISQMCTARQLRERPFTDWVRTLDIETAPPLERWSLAYAMQVASRYGMLEEGVRALVIGSVGGPVPAALARHGVRVTVIDDPELWRIDASRALRALARPALCDPDRFAELVEHRMIGRFDLRVHNTLVNYDLLLCDGIVGRFDSNAEANDFVERSMAHLRPGGLAFHLLPFDPVPLNPDRNAPRDLIFRMGDVERMALLLISQRMEVAQITADAHDVVLEAAVDGGDPTTRHGLIARRPASAF